MTISLKYEAENTWETTKVLERPAVQLARFETLCMDVHVIPSFEPVRTNDLGVLAGLGKHAVIVIEPMECTKVDWSCSHSPRIISPSTVVLAL